MWCSCTHPRFAAAAAAVALLLAHPMAWHGVAWHGTTQKKNRYVYGEDNEFWDDMRANGVTRQRFFTYSLLGVAVALGGNLFGVTSGLLSSVAPEASRALRVDLLFPVGGFKRCGTLLERRLEERIPVLVLHTMCQLNGIPEIVHPDPSTVIEYFCKAKYSRDELLPLREAMKILCTAYVPSNFYCCVPFRAASRSGGLLITFETPHLVMAFNPNPLTPPPLMLLPFFDASDVTCCGILGFTPRKTGTSSCIRKPG